MGLGEGLTRVGLDVGGSAVTMGVAVDSTCGLGESAEAGAPARQAAAVHKTIRENRYVARLKRMASF